MVSNLKNPSMHTKDMARTGKSEQTDAHTNAQTLNSQCCDYVKLTTSMLDNKKQHNTYTQQSDTRYINYHIKKMISFIPVHHHSQGRASPRR